MKKTWWSAAVASAAALSLTLGVAPAAQADKASDAIEYVEDYTGRVYDSYSKRLAERGGSQVFTPTSPTITVSEFEQQNADKSDKDSKAKDNDRSKDDEQKPGVPVDSAPNSIDSDFPSVADPAVMGDYWDNLDGLEVKQHKGLNPVLDEDGKAKKEKGDGSYDRDDFPHWELIGTEPTADDWPEGIPKSCDARQATLIRDGVDLKVTPKGCKIEVNKDNPEAGWTDAYGVPEKKGDEIATDDKGNVILKDYKHSDKPGGFDIDHIVSLNDVWETGAKGWKGGDAEKLRQQIANDPLNLTISDSSANRSKSAQTPAAYIPPGRFKCEYITRYVAVKAKYDLSVSEQDEDVLTRLGEYCDI